VARLRAHVFLELFQEIIMTINNKLLSGFALLAVVQFSYAQSAAETMEGVAPAYPATPYTSEGISGEADASVTPETSGASGEPRIDTITVISGPFATGSTDPFVQRREALAQAREEYRARQESAREEYREDRRDANTEFKESVR
jgi:hypothetical protein